MRNAARKKSSFKQLELCFETREVFQLPSACALQARATGLLRTLKAENLATCLRVEWNDRMRTTVGRADFQRSLILLNPALQKFGAAEIDRTLRHELAHLLAHSRSRRRILPHGREWRRACCDLGIPSERAGHTLPLVGRALRRRFVYRCGSCQRHFSRVRRIRRATACLDCCRRFSSGEYDERFRLHLVKGSRFSKVPALLAIPPSES